MAAQQQQKQAAAASVLQSFPFRAAVLALCVALLPLLPAAPEAGGEGGAGQALLAKVCELLHLLFVGIAVSYGLFSRKNSSAADHGLAGTGGGTEKDAAAAAAAPETVKADARYAWRMFRDSMAPFDDEDEEGVLPESPSPGGGGGGRERMRSWSAVHHRSEDPVVVVSGGGGGGGRNGQAALSLPVRALKPQPAAAAGETVLPSPIPWRSRSGRRPASPSPPPSPSPSPKRLSPASSVARETLAKASEEEYYAAKHRRSPYRSSSSSSFSSPPPAPPPPPPPPPFLVHGYHRPAVERRRAAAVAKSFKEELQDHNMRGRWEDDEDHYSPNTSVFNSAYSYSSNSSPAKPRNSFDGGGGGGGSSSAPVGKSVRTIRASCREPAAFQIQAQSQEELRDDAGDGRDAVGVEGLEESYGYRAYQSIPRFQYERSVSDPILGGVAVSSDDTESSDDDDDGDGGGAYSTRTTNSPRESTTPEVDENEVDKKAEEFIARFREQIRRQRIESIKKSAGPRGVKHHAGK
ncbi:unnamed protein product [Urochloa humidicola]